MRSTLFHRTGNFQSLGLPAGSLTPNTSTNTEAAAGSSAIQNTSLKSPPLTDMIAMAASGPATAPMVYSASLKPKPLPRISVGTISAIKASRGASRMPLPMRSQTRPAKTIPAVAASGNNSLLNIEIA